MSKTWYDLSSALLFRWTDKVLALLDLSLEKIMTIGYGWDWTEDDGRLPTLSDAQLQAELDDGLPGPVAFAL